MVNEGCLFKCPFRKFHFNYISHKSRNPGVDGTRGEDNVFSAFCLAKPAGSTGTVNATVWLVVAARELKQKILERAGFPAQEPMPMFMLQPTCF
jgi:hypothetical protein